MQKRSERHDGWIRVVRDNQLRRMSTEEKGVFMVMVATMWLWGGWLPAGDKELAKALGLGRHRWVTKYKPLLAPFFDEQYDPVRGHILVDREAE